MAFRASQTMRRRQWENPQNWTLSIDEWDRVLTFCQEQEAYQVFKSHGKKYVNMYDLNQEYVKPWTRGEGCGVAVMMSQEREDSAQLMLSHAWAEDVEECQSAVMEHVRQAALPRETALWFCLFANFQVGDESGPSIEAQLSLKPFASVISSASLRRGTGGYGLHAIHTSTADLYKRLWCVHEVERALKGDIDVSTSMSDKYKEQTLQRLQFFLSESCSTSTWEDCMWAANVKVKTIQARCDRMEDEKMLIAEIMATGGFERIDATIERFRAETFGQNYELMLKAVGRHGQALKFASFARLERKLIHNLVLTAVRSSGSSLAHAPMELKGDKDLVIEAVKQNGMALQYAAEEMRVDREVVLEAVQQHGLALQYASDTRLPGSALLDDSVVLAAVAQDGEAFRLAPDSMKKNRRIMEKAVTTSPKALQYVPHELQKEALEVVKSSPEAVAQLERSTTIAGIVIQTEQQVERMEEIAVTRRHAEVAEKTQERLQQAINLMKSVRPHVATQKPKRAIRLMLQGLESLFQSTQDPSAITRARLAIEKQFNTTTDEEKMDYVDVLLDRDVAIHPALKSSLFNCLAEYKSQLTSKAGVQADSSPSSHPVRRYSMQVPKLEPTPSMESERSDRHTGSSMTPSATPDLVAFTMSGTADGQTERFEKPWLMTFIMFVSMTLALPFDRGMWAGSKPGPLLGGQVVDHWRQKVIKVMYPAFFDILATGLCCMGFLYIPASVWQLLRGAEIVFAAIFAVTCLHRRLYCFQYIGLAFCVAGIFLVGLASVWSDDLQAAAKGKGSGNVQLLLLGICLALAGQVVQAAQAVAEEWLLRDVDLPGLQVVGFEGVWGALAMLVFVFPTLYMLPGQDHGHAEDEVNAYQLLRSNSTLCTLMGLYIFSCATYNISGIAVTGALSAVHRVMIEALRTLIVWAFGLSVHYLYDSKSALGEVWTPYSWLEVAGFLLLVIGQVIYGAMVKIPRLYYPPSEEISHDIVASPGSLRNLSAVPHGRLVSPGSNDGLAISPIALSP
ncbi:SLC35F6 [Symbiodinium pilosum]|uniref:SLC35F6 protein n=1 Tax=Symbiodinium pilosum TaxID=2952 RepID=A0A812VD02_SYMPI|nr:SLC35F6 [Symbiodinium pilosum]